MKRKLIVTLVAMAVCLAGAMALSVSQKDANKIFEENLEALSQKEKGEADCFISSMDPIFSGEKILKCGTCEWDSGHGLMIGGKCWF